MSFPSTPRPPDLPRLYGQPNGHAGAQRSQTIVHQSCERPLAVGALPGAVQAEHPFVRCEQVRHDAGMGDELVADSSSGGDLTLDPPPLVEGQV
jgi:hypothetical protein